MTTRVHIDRRRTPAEAGEVEARAVWDALLQPLPTLDPRYFYDDHGSALFERITRLDVYYQTRTERALLEAVADDIIAAASPRELVELGSGAGRKIHLLLDAMQRRGLLEGCVLLDINETFLEASCRRLAADSPTTPSRGWRLSPPDPNGCWCSSPARSATSRPTRGESSSDSSDGRWGPRTGS